MQYKCDFCQDTGSLNPSADLLDCVHCDTTTDRIALNKWLAEQYKQGTVGAVYEMDAWRIHQRALAMAPKQEAPARKPVAYMAFADNGNIRVWAEKDNLGAREAAERMGVTLMPVYAAPAAANGAPGYAEKASPIAITDSSALNGIKWYVPPPEHLRNGMQLYFVAPQPVAAAGPDAALVKALESALAIINNEADPDEYAAPLKLIRAALSGAKGN